MHKNKRGNSIGMYVKEEGVEETGQKRHELGELEEAPMVLSELTAWSIDPFL